MDPNLPIVSRWAPPSPAVRERVKDKDGRELMSRLEDYANKYRTVRMERRDGILQVTLHTEGQSLRWGFLPHGELPEAFHDIGGDRDNRVVILTGTGAEFSGPRATPGTSSFPSR